MKVSKLIDMLQKIVDPDDEVIMSKDREGNSFSPYLCFSGGKVEIDPYRPWISEVYDEIDINNGEYDEYDLSDLKDCIVLWPMN